jgi:hypothetical protein
MSGGIVIRGVLLIVYTFIVITIYIVASSPFEEIVSGMEDINMTASDAHIESSGVYVRLAFNLCFALAVIIPSLWFIVWVFHREPDWRYR